MFMALCVALAVCGLLGVAGLQLQLAIHGLEMGDGWKVARYPKYVSKFESCSKICRPLPQPAVCNCMSLSLGGFESENML